MSRKELLLVVALVLLFFGIRLAMIDADVPTWPQYNYSQIDESYYNLLALNFYKTSTLHSLDVAGIVKAIYAENFFANAITVVSLFTFGDNFFGLRLGHILFSTISFVFFLLLLRHATKNKSEFGESFGFLFMAFLGLLYAISQASIWPSVINEPTGTRIASIIIFIYLLLKISEKAQAGTLSSQWYSFFVGALASFSTLYVYPSNFFLLPSSLLVAFSISSEDDSTNIKAMLNSLMWWLLGLMPIALSYGLIRYVLKSLGEGISYDSFTGRILQDIPYLQVYTLLKTSFFRDNAPLIVTILFCGFILLRNAPKKDILFKIISFTLLFMAFQFLFINDYYMRKNLVLFPLVLLVIPYAYSSMVGLRMNLPKIAQYLFLTTCISLSYYFLQRNLFGDIDIIVFIASISLSTLALFFVMFEKNVWAQWIFVVITVLLLAVPIATITGTITDKTTNFKNCMIKMNKSIPENAYVFGFAHGFWLYNKWTPVGDEYIYSINYKDARQEDDVRLMKSKFPDKPIYKIALVPQSTINTKLWEIVENIDTCTDNPYVHPVVEYKKLFLLKYKK